MDDKKLIAEALLEISRERSETTFIEIGSEDKELIEAAKKINIVLPSPDLAIMKTVYAEIDKPNRNGVILPRQAVVDGLPTLVGKQCNWEHEGAGHVCGYTISAKLNGDKIETINVVFKSLFPEEMKDVAEKFKTKKFTVSFEIWNIDPETKATVVNVLENGFKEISKIIFHGTGLLLSNKPACPKAIVYKLLANEDTKFEENLVFAELAVEKSLCKNCGTCTCNENKEVEKVDIPEKIVEKVAEEAQKKEEPKIEEILDNDYEGGEIEEAKKLTTEQRNALPDSDFALIQVKDGKKIRRFPINDEAHVRNALARLPQAKDLTEEERKTCLENILKRAKEFKMEDIIQKHMKAEEHLCPECQKPMKEDEEICAECKKKKESANLEEPKKEESQTTDQKSEEKAQVEDIPSVPKKLVKIVTYYTEIVEEIITESGSTISKSGKEVVVRVYDDNSEEKVERDVQIVNKYTQAELDEAINKAKEESEKSHKIEIESKLNESKVEHENKIKEKDTEIANLKTQVEQKTQEIATIKAKEEEKTPPTLEVGNVDKKDKSYYLKRREKIDEKAYGKPKEQKEN